MIKARRVGFCFVLITIVMAPHGDAFAGVGGRILHITRFEGVEVMHGVPTGWELERFRGTPRLGVRRNGNDFCLHLLSDEKSFFGIKKKMSVNLRDYPILNWRWKASKLPKNGDVRKAATDDQAIQIYIAFSSLGFPERLNTPVVGYIWDNEAPKGWSGRSPQTGLGKVRYVVMRNGEDQMDRWYSERRNLYEDYRTLFSDVADGKLKGMTEGIALMINSQHTGSNAESMICNLYFSKD